MHAHRPRQMHTNKQMCYTQGHTHMQPRAQTDMCMHTEMQAGEFWRARPPPAPVPPCRGAAQGPLTTTLHLPASLFCSLPACLPPPPPCQLFRGEGAAPFTLRQGGRGGSPTALPAGECPPSPNFPSTSVNLGPCSPGGPPSQPGMHSWAKALWKDRHTDKLRILLY